MFVAFHFKRFLLSVFLYLRCMKFFWRPEESSIGSSKFFGASVLVLLGFIFVGSLIGTLVLLALVPDANEALKTGQFNVENKNGFLVANLIPFFIGLLFAQLASKFILKRSLLSMITLRSSIDWKRFLLAFLCWGIISGIPIFIDIQLRPQVYRWNFEGVQFSILLVISIVLLPLQTLFEELLLRSFFLQFFGMQFKRGIIGIIGTGLIFAAMHLTNSEVSVLGWGAIVFYLLSGWMTALLTTMDDGLELSWGFHTANNLIGVLFITNSWQSFQTDALLVDTSVPSMTWDLIVTMTVGYVIYVLIFAAIFKWKNWKQRIFLKEPLTIENYDTND